LAMQIPSPDNDPLLDQLADFVADVFDGYAHLLDEEDYQRAKLLLERHQARDRWWEKFAISESIRVLRLVYRSRF
jgi:hypothetical protein